MNDIVAKPSEADKLSMKEGAAKKIAWLEACIAMGLALAGAYFAVASARLPSGPDPSAPGPGVAPGLLGIVLLLAGLVLAVQALRNPAPATGKTDPTTENGALRKAIVAVVLLTATAFLLEPLGFMLSTFLFLLAGFVWLGGANWRAALPAAAVASVSLWLFFTKLLGVGLPFGRLVEILFY